jgi:hypothetical protein
MEYQLSALELDSGMVAGDHLVERRIRIVENDIGTGIATDEQLSPAWSKSELATAEACILEWQDIE